MGKKRTIISYFSKGEWMLWKGSMLAILVSFFLFDRAGYLTLTASLIGVTSLIFSAKGNWVGQLLMILFSLCYGIISYTFAYYGEMITYLGMTMPMAVFSMIVWIRNPYEKKKTEVEIRHLSFKEWIFLGVMAGAVTFAFYFVLDYFKTANMIPSTISVTTSFAAVYLTFRRSPYYALGYAANDIVLIILWMLAAAENISYLSVVICFVVFFFNDMYGYVNWKRMGKRQCDAAM